MITLIIIVYAASAAFFTGEYVAHRRRRKASEADRRRAELEAFDILDYCDDICRRWDWLDMSPKAAEETINLIIRRSHAES